MKLGWFEFGADRYRPKPPDPSPDPPPDPSDPDARTPRSTFDVNLFTFFIGGLAIFLPLSLLIYAAIGGNLQPTISDFYHVPVIAGDLFVGILVGLALLMFAYRGEHSSEAGLASLGAVFALGIAFFPTDGWFPERQVQPYEAVTSTSDYNLLELLMNNPINFLHLLFALLLFLLLAFFCFFVFTRTRFDGHEKRPRKQKRDRAYRICGSVIVLAILAIGLGHSLLGPAGAHLWNDYRAVFFLEAIALIAFGYSWLLKSKFGGRLALDEEEAAFIARGEMSDTPTADI